MKKVMFTVAGVSVICACGLVIDPDKLVEGNGSEQDSGLTDVTTLVYPGARHEIFNDVTQEDVRGDLLAWLDRHFPARD